MIGLIPLLNYTVIEQRISKAPPPLTKPRPIGVAHSKREIPNFAGMSITKELTKVILRGPLNSIGLIPLLNYTVIQQMVSNGAPLLNIALLGRIIPNAKFQISLEWD